MNLKKKEIILVKHGISESILNRMTDEQINSLYIKLTEQVQQKTTVGPQGGSVTLKPGQTKVDLKPVPNSPGTMEVTEDDLDEKAVSQKQQEFFGVVRAMQKGKLPKKGKAGKAAKDMSKKDVKDFASTKHKGLPIHANEETSPLMTLAKQKMANNYISAVNKTYPTLTFGEGELEEKITNLVEKHIHPSMTKNDLITTIKNLVTESPIIEELDEELTENQLPNWLQWNSIKQNKK
jgi:hypothetical protein